MLKSEREAHGIPPSHRELWNFAKIWEVHMQHASGNITGTPGELCGVVDFPVWSFVDVRHFLVPILHLQIGLGNNALDSFYDWVDERIEMLCTISCHVYYCWLLTCTSCSCSVVTYIPSMVLVP